MPLGFQVTLLARALALQNPVRGGMVIEICGRRRFSFCFSAARQHRQVLCARERYVVACGVVPSRPSAAEKQKEDAGIAHFYTHATPSGVSAKSITPLNRER